ncbi:hypothetical protein DEO72_LG9g1015 [Vigna unguiculata]|uniref:Uncharacterized protein n=1 Tax=Vigna unguiculata TaxID=3917 RepID=A0A4D6MX25_VIGUN|nr:hypothetical protein DEO72_LG9g1015 [Vigna unguiculata]
MRNGLDDPDGSGRPDDPTGLVRPDDPNGSGWSRNQDELASSARKPKLTRLGQPGNPDKPDQHDGPYGLVVSVKFVDPTRPSSSGSLAQLGPLRLLCSPDTSGLSSPFVLIGQFMSLGRPDPTRLSSWSDLSKLSSWLGSYRSLGLPDTSRFDIHSPCGSSGPPSLFGPSDPLNPSLSSGRFNLSLSLSLPGPSWSSGLFWSLGSSNLFVSSGQPG